MKRTIGQNLGVAGAALILLSGCSDFFNSKTAVSTPKGAAEKTVRPDINPLPPGFENPNAGAFSESKMLVNLGLNVVSKSTAKLNVEAAALRQRIDELCPAVDAKSDDRELDPSKLAEAKSQWKRTMLAFHFVDSAPVGPLWADDKTVSTQIYAWPLFNSCGIDVETLKVFEGLGTPVTDLPVPVRGLAAIEYLLFEPKLESKCNARAYPQIAAWVGRSTSHKSYDRCRMATGLAKDVLERTEILQREWNPSGRNFTKTLIDGTDPQMKTPKDATNAFSDSLFQIETVKDVRLGRPLGRHRDCVSDAGKCPESIEHSYSNFALQAVEVRLLGFESAFFGVFEGEEGFGFDDLLVSRGHKDIADRLRVLVKDGLRAAKNLAKTPATDLKTIVDTMDSAACAETTRSDRKVEVCGLFQDVRDIATVLKAEVMSVLALRAPPTYQGDND